jgi:transposase
LGASQKVLDRVAHALEPPYTAIAPQGRQAAGNYIDETPWCLTPALQGLWVMGSDTAALDMMHPHRSKDACAARIDDWAGILVSEGYGVSRHGVQARQTCPAPLIRTARGVAARDNPALAACGTWALAELQRLCQMATAPPTGGEWRAGYARLCKLIDQYHDHTADAGRFTRRLVREMNSLGVFLAQHGVEPTHNRAERA